MKVTDEMVERAFAVSLGGRVLIRNILEAALAGAPEPNVCEVCNDCLVPEPPRCEKHAYTEPGDDEWERHMEPRGKP